METCHKRSGCQPTPPRVERKIRRLPFAAHIMTVIRFPSAVSRLGVPPLSGMMQISLTKVVREDCMNATVLPSGDKLKPESDVPLDDGTVRQRLCPVSREKTTIPIGSPGTQRSSSSNDFPSIVHAGVPVHAGAPVSNALQVTSVSLRSAPPTTGTV
jgi:hypothetical protein